MHFVYCFMFLRWQWYKQRFLFRDALVRAYLFNTFLRRFFFFSPLFLHCSCSLSLSLLFANKVATTGVHALCTRAHGCHIKKFVCNIQFSQPRVATAQNVHPPLPYIVRSYITVSDENLFYFHSCCFFFSLFASLLNCRRKNCVHM